MATTTTTTKAKSAPKVQKIAKKSTPKVAPLAKETTQPKKPTIVKKEQPKVAPKSSKIVSFDDFWTKLGSQCVSDGHGVRGIVNLALKHANNNVSFQEFVRHNPYNSQTTEQYVKLAFEFKSPTTAA